MGLCSVPAFVKYFHFEVEQITCDVAQTTWETQGKSLLRIAKQQQITILERGYPGLVPG